MPKIKTLCVFGTRPDAIKMAPVVLELKRRPEFDTKVAVTGQHREMLDQVLSVFGIVPDTDLNIMAHGQTLAQVTTRSLEGLDPILAEMQPDWVLAQGDTTTTFVAALAAFYHRAAFGHVEAGLRTGNPFDPYPEEMNRLLTTRLATLHFAPTPEAAANLRSDGVGDTDILMTGNTVIDSLLQVAEGDYAPGDTALQSVFDDPRRMVLVTAHRRENWGEPMAHIGQAVRTLVQTHPDIVAVVALHRNPIVRDTLVPLLSGLDRVRLIEPPDYVPFVKLQQKATLILTDSGGVQEEAPSLGKPVLVLRETTERPEGVQAGTAKLVGTDTQAIVTEASRLLSDPDAYARMAHAVSPYGDGQASARIADALCRRPRGLAGGPDVTAPSPSSPRRDSLSRAESWFGQFWKLLVRLALIAFLGYFLWRVRSILTDVLVAAVLAFALIGPVNWLCRFRIKQMKGRTQRLCVTLFVFLTLFVVVYQSVRVMVSPFQTEAQQFTLHLPEYEQRATNLASSAKVAYAKLPPDLRAFLQKQNSSGAAPSPSDWARNALEATFTGLAGIIDKIVHILLIPVLAFYFVLDGHALRNEFLALLPRRRIREARTLLRETSAIMRTYVIAQFWLCVIAGVVVYIGLSAVGMKYALILGLLAGVTRAIPIIGPIIGGIPILLLALVTGGPLLAAKVLIFFSALHLIESKLLMPKFIGRQINLHAALVIIVLLIGAEFFGLLGMFFAAPLAALGRVLVQHYVIRPRRLADRSRVASPAPLVITTHQSSV